MKEIEFESLTPNLMVAEVGQSLKFYEHLGFTLAMSVPDESPYHWAMIQKEGARLMLQSIDNLHEDIPALKSETPGGGFTLFLKMKGIDALYEKIKSSVKIVDDMRSTFYQTKEFTIQDPDGYFITFAEPQ